MANDPSTQGQFGTSPAPSTKLPPLAPPGGAQGPLYGKGWDLVQLGGVQLPGLWKVVGGGITIKVDRKKKPGADGGNPTFHGINPEVFEIEGLLYTNEQREKFVDVCKQLVPQPGSSQKAKPLLFQHPSVMHFGFAINVYIIGASPLAVTGVGRTTTRLRLQHWLPDKKNASPATSTPTQSTRSKITDDKNAQNPPNPKPTDQQGAGGLPVNFTPG